MVKRNKIGGIKHGEKKSWKEMGQNWASQKCKTKEIS